MRKVEFTPVDLRGVAAIFSIKIDSDRYSEYQKFFIAFRDTDDKYLKDDLGRIAEALRKISEQGALDRILKPGEGKYKDRVCAIPLDIVHRNKNKHGTLRLYCIKVSDKLIILGSGGLKTTDTYNKDKVLDSAVSTLQSIDKELYFLERDGKVIEDEITNLVIYID